MEMGAVRRLDLAQFLYQFPLGVFAIALATAIFPSLQPMRSSTNATSFKRVLRTGHRGDRSGKACPRASA